MALLMHFDDFLFYRNESWLWMPIDRTQTQTHVISCIYHIASSDNAEPRPILKPGDILLYESAKNLHEHPHKFNGDWYTSLFIHFYPKDQTWSSRDHHLDSHYAIPEDEWYNTLPSNYPEIRLFGTSMMEPECPDSWCHLLNAVELEGPGEYAQVLTAGDKNTHWDCSTTT